MYLFDLFVINLFQPPDHPQNLGPQLNLVDYLNHYVKWPIPLDKVAQYCAKVATITKTCTIILDYPHMYHKRYRTVRCEIVCVPLKVHYVCFVLYPGINTVP